MCGRIALYTPPSRLARFLEATLAAGIEPEGRPSWNVGPLRTLFGVHEGPEGRVLETYRWGLVPSWAKDATVAHKLFNARGETVAEKPSFRSAFRSRACVIPVDGFFEWDHRPATAKTPHYFSRCDGEPLLLAGLFEHWRDPAQPDGPVLRTCTVLTTAPSEDMAQIHDRMPVILERDAVADWLTPGDHGQSLRHALVQSAPTGTLQHHVVDARVGNVRHDGADLISEAAPTTLF